MVFREFSQILFLVVWHMLFILHFSIFILVVLLGTVLPCGPFRFLLVLGMSFGVPICGVGVCCALGDQLLSCVV